MELHISHEHAQFLNEQVAAGLFASREAAVEAALSLLQNQAATREKVQRGCEQLERGEYTEFDDAGLDAYFNELFDLANDGEDA